MKISEIINKIKHLLTSEQIILLYLLEEFDHKIVDENKITIFEKNSYFIIEVFSVGDKSCSFTFDFGIKDNSNQFRFYLNKSAPIIEVEMTNLNLLQTIEFVNEIFRSEIFEELTFVKNVLVKAKYKYYSVIYGERKLIPHVTFKKAFWFFKKKDIKAKEYEPWIR